MAEKSGLTKTDCEKALIAFTESVQDALKEDDRVQIIGFGTFEVKDREARTGVNPRTGDPVDIPASKVPAFKAGKALKDTVNT